MACPSKTRAETRARRHSRRSARIAGLALVVAASACSSRTRDEGPIYVANPDAGVLPLEIGTGFASFDPVVDGETVVVIAGPQGGFHIWTSIRVADPQLDSVQVTLSAYVEGDPTNLAGRPSRLVVPLAPDPSAPGKRTHAGMTNFITDPATVRGLRIVLRAESVAADGRSSVAECIVVPL
jgi:hypothetical protein